MMMLALSSGCASWQEAGGTEGRAAAILDASEAPARACAGDLADGTLPIARASCAPLLAGLAEWWGR